MLSRQPSTADGILDDEFSRELDEQMELLYSKASGEADSACKPHLEGLCTMLSEKVGLKDVQPLPLWKMLTLFRLYDHPYDVHLFVPPGDGETELNSCLALTTPRNAELSHNMQAICTKLSEVLSQLPEFEAILLQRRSRDMFFKEQWDRYFPELIKPYERLEQYTKLLAKALVDAADVPVEWTRPAARVKSSGSTFEKLVGIVNTRETDTWARSWAAIRSGEREQLDTELKELNDIVGVRIECTFESVMYQLMEKLLAHAWWDQTEVNQFWHGFDPEDRRPADKEFADFTIKSVTQHGPRAEEQDGNAADGAQGEKKNAYRSLHIVLTLGASRGKLIEYRGLAERRFELQLRSVLMHGWAEVSHDIEYKNDYPKHLLSESEVGGVLQSTSKALQEQDLEFNKVRTVNEKMRRLTR